MKTVKRNIQLALTLSAAVQMMAVSAQASGVVCEAQCVVLDHQTKEVFILDTALETQASASRTQVLRSLRAKCQRDARDQGFYLGGPVQAHLFNTIEWSEDHSSYLHTTSQHTWDNGYWGYYHGPRYSSGSSTYEQSSGRRDHLSLKTTPATTRNNCRTDRSIPNGQTEEYLGDQPLQ